MLGIRQKGTILCRTNNNIVIVQSITEEEEQYIDNAVKYYGEIRHIKNDGTIIHAKDIYLYGEIDFNNEDDIFNIENFNLINSNSDSHNWTYSNFDFEKGCCTTIDGSLKVIDINDPLQWFKYNYVLIGKPKRIIVYKQMIKKK